MAQYEVRDGFGILGDEVRSMVDKNLDCKIVLTSYNSKPGLGKTTLAILMARAWDQHGWTAKEKGFVTYEKFANAYMESPPGTVLLFDEVENEADKRRANSVENVGLSQMLATQRARNIISIYTLPAISMLDSRVMELADYWVNVGIGERKGVAFPYKLRVNDFSWVQRGKSTVYPQRLGNEFTIKWEDLPDNDKDKAYLDDKKPDLNSVDREYIPISKVKSREEKAAAQAERDRRDEIINGLFGCDRVDVSTHDLAEVQGIDLSQQRISQIKNAG